MSLINFISKNEFKTESYKIIIEKINITIDILLNIQNNETIVIFINTMFDNIFKNIIKNKFNDDQLNCITIFVSHIYNIYNYIYMEKIIDYININMINKKYYTLINFMKNINTIIDEIIVFIRNGPNDILQQELYNAIEIIYTHEINKFDNNYNSIKKINNREIKYIQIIETIFEEIILLKNSKKNYNDKEICDNIIEKYILKNKYEYDLFFSAYIKIIINKYLYSSLYINIIMYLAEKIDIPHFVLYLSKICIDDVVNENIKTNLLILNKRYEINITNLI